MTIVVRVYAVSGYGGTDLHCGSWFDGEVLAELVVILLSIHLVPQYKPSNIVDLQVCRHAGEVLGLSEVQNSNSGIGKVLPCPRDW